MIKKFKIFEISAGSRFEYGNIFMKDYWDRNDMNILNDLKELKNKRIQYKLMHHKEDNDNFFKIITNTEFSVLLLRTLGFKYIPQYSTTWAWEEISDSDIKYIITTSKYNL